MVTHLPATLWCSLKHYAYRERDRPTAAVEPGVFEEILADYDEEAVFVHVGLSDVGSAFGDDGYSYLTETLRSEFDAVLTPGFTQSFHETGTFDVAETEPELGAFASLFFEEADYRTPDPLHSILVAGDYRFDDCTVRDTFAPDGCYGKLDADNVRILDVGTQWLVSTQLHYVERVTDVPYAETIAVEGAVRDESGEAERVTQRNYDKNNYVYFWNRLAIQRELMADGVLDHHDLNGLSVISVGARDLRTALEPRIEDDPYYLVR